jgi:hypothetical protein
MEEIMSKRTIGIVLIVIGVVLAIVSLADDAIGIGTYPGINSAQLLGAAVGIIIALVGVWLGFNKAPQK